MILALKKGELKKFFIDILIDSNIGITYCLDRETYFFLRESGMTVDMCYLYRGILYDNLGDNIDPATLLIRGSDLKREFLNRNVEPSSNHEEYKCFREIYRNVFTQEKFLESYF